MDDYDTLLEASGRQDWPAVIADATSRPNYLADSRLVSQLSLAYLKAKNFDALAKLAQALSNTPEARKTLGRANMDAAYLSAFSFLFPDRIRREIEQRNTGVVDDEKMQEVVAALCDDSNALAAYVDARADVFRRRYFDEYRYLQALPSLRIYPYKYIVDYAYSNVVPPAARAAPLTVDFIYCIKNRVERATLSLRSLDAAYATYRNNGGRDLEVRATISEDTSPNVLDIAQVKLTTLPTSHYVVDTGVGWTRSGLLNYGIRRSEADLLAFVDADFLFHQGFVGALERALRHIDLSRNAIATTLVETEAHTKDGKTYSQGSPYGHLWMTSRRVALSVTGFDEGYSGHGFEDRDFEAKLVRTAELTVCDTASIDPECFVLHLSHEARSGDHQREVNRDRFTQRKQLTPVELRQEHWGEFPLVHHDVHEQPIDTAPHPAGLVDFLLFPHNQYHGRTFLQLRDEFRSRGYSTALVDISPPHSNEGAKIAGYESEYVALSDVMNGSIRARVIGCMNDWEPKVVRQLVMAANEGGVPTIGIVEGVNDFDDVDTGRSRSAYKRVRHVLLNGNFDRKYFADSSQDVRVTGIQRLDPLHAGMRTRKDRGQRPKALVNVNFSYGVLRQHRESWLREIATACERAGFEMITSQHRADDADLSQYNRSERPLYELLAECDVFISRFSGAILEALVMGANVIYYNSGFEKIDKFMTPLGAYVWAKDQTELLDAMQLFASGGVLDPRGFIAEHCHIAPDELNAPRKTSIEATANAMIEVIRESPFSSAGFEAFRQAAARRLATRGTFAPQPDHEASARLLAETTFGIKSFGRSRHLTALVASILRLYPTAKILVCDDSETGPGPLPAGVEVLRPRATDIGISAGRNLLLDHCATTYFVLLDENFVFTKQTSIPSLIGALGLYDIDIAGGAIHDIGPSAPKKDQPRAFHGVMDLTSDGTFAIATGRVRRWRNNLPLYDLVPNFFACRTESVRRVRWTEALKLGEHLDFFLRARDAGLKVSYFTEVVVDHYHDQAVEDYKVHRPKGR